ncbi:hypothetical protein BOX15_Mlig018796g1 [Macrostomum lignano]|uniref:Uncharacterized protein n=2 Tax=Macrostomum lignano TaxID=282301 RepID=A0A267F7G8_9PLAT|nr:hypothetical protein BOX15_Mlig018796g1 [Macrostomum lignano]
MALVSVIIPVHNAESWLSEAIQSAVNQNFSGNLEISVYNDSSSDSSANILNNLKQELSQKVYNFVISGHNGKARGCGYAKNCAVAQSSGEYLCFLDADDVMLPHRIAEQLSLAVSLKNKHTIVGSQFHRKPDGSTARFTAWANQLTPVQLVTQVYTSHGPTVIMPTWFMHRSVFDRVGGFNQSAARGFPEDLEFFFKHLDCGGGVARVDADLLMYRYHPAATTFSVHESAIFRLRMDRLVARVLPGWPSFSVWNAGKQGRRFYRALPPDHRRKVAAFCDVDPKKIQLGFYTFEESSQRPKPRIPIVHFSTVKPPLIICAKLDLTGGQLESNLDSLGLTEGVDYYWFS